ncbi:MAG: hypothetical protein PF450_08035 [Bacteroidales bacterium]|nr:hypothetical protein [Bacteroidales bacterium]
MTVALVGARNRKQTEENAKAMDIVLSEDEVKFIGSHLNSLELVGI